MQIIFFYTSIYPCRSQAWINLWQIASQRASSIKLCQIKQWATLIKVGKQSLFCHKYFVMLAASDGACSSSRMAHPHMLSRCLPAQAHKAITRTVLGSAVEGHESNSRAHICSFVWGGAQGCSIVTFWAPTSVCSIFYIYIHILHITYISIIWWRQCAKRFSLRSKGNSFNLYFFAINTQ